MAAGGDQEIPSCTARPLQSLAVSRLADMLLDMAIPSARLKEYIHNTYTQTLQDFNAKIEDLLGSPLMPGDQGKDEEDELSSNHEAVPLSFRQFFYFVVLAEPGNDLAFLLPAQKILLEHLQALVRWWREECWVGGGNSWIAYEMHQCCHERLKRHSASHPLYPLLVFTLRLLFCHEARYGSTKNDSHICMEDVMEVVKLSYAGYGRFLSLLPPFSITQLYICNLSTDFQPIITTICRNSPRLRLLHMKVEIARENDFAIGSFLREIGKVTPNLDTLVILTDEFEVFDAARGCLHIVTSAGKNFEKVLFCGFFDGMKKKDVAQQIEQGQVEEIPLSFPKLKYVDVGSHKDVREFLHYLLHLYPNLLSISCDEDGWNLYKYSFESFSTVTPSTLGNDPMVLESVKKPYMLREMSFTSFCLHSQFAEIMKQYLNLDHIGLSLVWGQRSNCNVGQMAKDLLVSANCHCLTVINDSYMFRVDFIKIYQPVLQAVGSKLTVLQFHLTNEVHPEAIRELINLCHSLQELAIVSSCERCEVAEYDSDDDKVLKLIQLPSLKCLGVSSPYNVTRSLSKMITDLLSVSPNLTTLDLDLAARKPIDLLRRNMAGKKLARLECLRLTTRQDCFLPSHRCSPDVKMDVCIDLESIIARAPNLTVLMMGKSCMCLLSLLKKRFGHSKLQIIIREEFCVAFRSIATRGRRGAVEL